MGHIIVIDDHPLFRDALSLAVSQSERKGDLCHQAASLDEAKKLLSENPIDLALLDLHLGDSQGLEAVSQITTHFPDLSIIVVSALASPEAISGAQALGAKGYLSKNAALEDMVAAINAVSAGQTAFPKQSGDRGSSAAIDALSSLTPAQRRVMDGLAGGLLNKQIAYEMGISEATVKAHMTAIFRKLGANNRTQALLIYRQATILADANNL